MNMVFGLNACLNARFKGFLFTKDFQTTFKFDNSQMIRPFPSKQLCEKQKKEHSNQQSTLLNSILKVF
jgi:hypothetical protein